MASHSANSLFDLNIESAEQCLSMYDGLSHLQTGMNLDWLLRASIVFTVSALDAYFHDRVKFKAAKFSLATLPPQLAKFPIPLSEVEEWEKSQRKGNAIRNWVARHYSVRPLQSPDSISEAFRLVGYNGIWDCISNGAEDKKHMLSEFNKIIKRRNQIAHEGDREQHRNSGKRLRTVTRNYAKYTIDFAKVLVERFELGLPK